MIKHALLVLTAFSILASKQINADVAIFQKMSTTEREASGLHKLSATEIQYLQHWINANGYVQKVEDPQLDHRLNSKRDFHENASAGDSNPITESALEQARREIKAQYEAAESQQSFNAKVTEDFSGWTNNTLFVLENGQIWQQRHGRPYKHKSDDREVRFESNLMGLWRMTVISSARSVAVKRVE